MTAKEKAKDLVRKLTYSANISRWEAIQCALIAVEEVQKTLSEYVFTEIEFWEAVKDELKKM